MQERDHRECGYDGGTACGEQRDVQRGDERRVGLLGLTIEAFASR